MESTFNKNLSGWLGAIAAILISLQIFDLSFMNYLRYAAIALIYLFLISFLVKNILRWHWAVFSIIGLDLLGVLVLGHYSKAIIPTNILTLGFFLFCIVFENKSTLNIFKWSIQPIYTELKIRTFGISYSKAMQIFLYEVEDMFPEADFHIAQMPKVIQSFKSNPSNFHLPNDISVYKAFEIALFNSIVSGNYIYRGTPATDTKIRYKLYLSFLRLMMSKGYYSPAEADELVKELKEIMKNNG